MRTFSLLVLAGLLVALVSTAYADPTAPTNVQVFDTSSRSLGGDSNGSIKAQGGNVTQVNIDGLSITETWQGYYGNISGNIHLDDASNNSFYTWGNATPAGEVFASRNSTIDWSTINCTNDTQRKDEETFLNQSTPDGDSVTNTFNATVHPGFLVGSTQIAASSCFSTNVNVNGTAQNETFYQILLSDNSSNIIYTTIIEDAEYAFNSELADFQLMVGESEKAGSEGPTSYYFFLELS